MDGKQVKLILAGAAGGALLIAGLVIAFELGGIFSHPPERPAAQNPAPQANNGGNGQQPAQGRGPANGAGGAGQRNGGAPAVARGGGRGQAPAVPAGPANHLTETPNLEIQRAANDNGNTDPQTGVKLAADFDCAYVPPKVEKLSDTHFVLDFDNKDAHWFMFKLTGVAGKTVRVDLKNVMLEKWFTLNPVYQYADGAVPALSLPLPPDNFNLSSAKLIDGHNGTRMPTGEGPGDWHYAPVVWATNGWTLCFDQTFDKDEVTVAMRPPFTLDDEAALMEEVRQDQAPADMKAQVIDIGSTPDGHMLHVVKFSSGGEAGEKQHPCILMYAREHADEQDSSWPLAGAIKRLLANDRVAMDLRRKYTFLLIPMLDMDLAAKSGHENVIASFISFRNTPESLSYGKFFQAWMKTGKPLDIVLNLHCMISTESDNMVAALFPPDDSPLAAPTKALHDRIRNDEQSHGLRVLAYPWYHGFSPERLGGWLGNTYGALHLPYEINMQEQHRHLNVGETEALGPVLLRAAAGLLGSNAEGLLAKTAEQRRSYSIRWEKYGTEVSNKDLFSAETEVKGLQESAQLLEAMTQKK